MDISNASVVGMKGEDHVLIIGGSGSGKSSAIIKPTLITWKGAACITDIKGELSDFYITQYKRGIVNRKPIVFDPKNPDSPSYDPYYTMIHGDPKDLVSNAKTIVNSIFPSQYNHGDLFWIESVRSFSWHQYCIYTVLVTASTKLFELFSPQRIITLRRI